MKDDVPVIYWVFRSAWTFVHFVVVAVAGAALFTWALADDHAVRIWETSRTNVLDVQYRVSNVIPWPWAIDDNGGGSDPFTDDGTSGSTDAPTVRIRVVSDLNVRRRPTPDSKVMQVLEKGSWVEADCKVENGALVKSGPHGPSSRWDHIEGLGYISDAYVSTNTSGLPEC